MKFPRIALVLALAVAAALPSAAAKRSAKAAPKAAVRAQPARENPYRKTPYVGALSADAKSGRILFEERGGAKAYPASVTKLMTLLLVLEDVRAKRYSLDSVVKATPDVYRCEASWIGLKVDETMSVRDLCYALMVESANDSAIALGVHSAGSFQAFVDRMNARAAELGMANTAYYNPNGLPPKAKYPWKSFNYTTAEDQLKLALKLLSYPETLAFTSVKTCDLIKTAGGYRVGVTRVVNRPAVPSQIGPGEKLIKQFNNHNNIMRTEKLKVRNPDGTEAVDGLKTGYIDAGGSSIVLTGTRRGKRVIVVVLGSSSAKERDAAARRLLEDALTAVSL